MTMMMMMVMIVRHFLSNHFRAVSAAPTFLFLAKTTQFLVVPALSFYLQLTQLQPILSLRARFKSSSVCFLTWHPVEMLHVCFNWKDLYLELCRAACWFQLGLQFISLSSLSAVHSCRNLIAVTTTLLMVAQSLDFIQHPSKTSSISRSNQRLLHRSSSFMQLQLFRYKLSLYFQYRRRHFARVFITTLQ